MWGWVHAGISVTVLALVLLANLVGVGMVVAQLPGTWLILGVTILTAWAWPGTFSLWTIAGLGLLALIGEIIEFAASSVGSTQAGGSRRGALLAIVGAITGAILGTPVMPVIGTVLGACVGAGIGSMAGDRWAGRSWEQASVAGRGAAVGRFWGTIGKIAIAVVMWFTVAVAIFWP